MTTPPPGSAAPPPVDYHDALQSAERLAAALLETLLNAIDAIDAQTGSHVRRVAQYALILADAADVDQHAHTDIERIALFHDIGKIDEALFDVIHDTRKLTKPDRLKILSHPQRGAAVLAPLCAFYPTLSEGVLSHHERWDGTGYPRRLRGTDIPFAARIIALADTFDAITHSRRYRAGQSPSHAAARIAEGRATQFDPDLTDLFLCPPVMEELTEAMHTAHARHAPPAGDRRHGATESAPDITFRWRDATPERHPPVKRR